MANTYAQIYIQFVFAVFGRGNFVPQKHKEELHKYISGIVAKRNQKLLAVNCMRDHCHLFIGYKPTVLMTDFIRDVKAASSGLINEKKWIVGKFAWQEGYGAFSYSRSQIDYVVNYILNQEAHHRKKKFKEEYLDLLHEFEIEYNERYLFEWYE